MAPEITGPDLCDYFFLWGYVKNRVYVPPLSAIVDELQERITAAVNSVTPDMLQRVWSALDYRIDVCRVTKREGTLSVCDTTWNCMSLCNCNHQFCTNIPVSFNFITTWNQGVFCVHPVFSSYFWFPEKCLLLNVTRRRIFFPHIYSYVYRSLYKYSCLWVPGTIKLIGTTFTKYADNLIVTYRPHARKTFVSTSPPLLQQTAHNVTHKCYKMPVKDVSSKSQHDRQII